MTLQPKAAAVRPLTLAWVTRQLDVGERIVATEALHGGITAEMRKLTVATQAGSTRELVLRSYVDPFYLGYAEDLLNREADALILLTSTAVPAPRLVAADLAGAQCEYPSLLMTHLAGRTVLEDEGVATRVPLLARQLVEIHALRPAKRIRGYVTLTTADTVVIPECADGAVWAAAIDLLRGPTPAYEGRFLHRDFQPGNVLFDVAPGVPSDPGISGVVDWAGTSWGPADLDVAHCATNLALLHGPEWGLRFAEAYEGAGGVLATDLSDRLYWRVRDGLACSEEVQVVAQPWRQAGRTELTTQAVEARLDAYLTLLMDETSPARSRFYSGEIGCGEA